MPRVIEAEFALSHLTWKPKGAGAVVELPLSHKGGEAPKLAAWAAKLRGGEVVAFRFRPVIPEGGDLEGSWLVDEAGFTEPHWQGVGTILQASQVPPSEPGDQPEWTCKVRIVESEDHRNAGRILGFVRFRGALLAHGVSRAHVEMQPWQDDLFEVATDPPADREDA